MTEFKSALLTEFTPATDGGGELSGEFTAVVSVFDNIDHVGDVVMPGAFTDSIKAWQASGDPIPVVWNHQWADPECHIGKVTEITETARGLVVRGQIDLDGAKSRQVAKLLAERRIREFSFAFDIDEARMSSRVKADGARVPVRELHRLTITEVGPTLKGANPAAVLLEAKNAPAEADPDAPESTETGQPEESLDPSENEHGGAVGGVDESGDAELADLLLSIDLAGAKARLHELTR